MLERTALRLAATMALANAFREPYPTIAGDKVFDSRMDPIEGHLKDELVPLLLVYTDDTELEGLSNNNGGPPWRPMCDLVLELSLGMIGTTKEGEIDPLPLQIETEPELEAMLDVFEAQVERALFHPTNTWANKFEHVLAKRPESWSSTRFVERDSQVRIAARQLRLRCQLLPTKCEEPVLVVPGDDPPAAPPVPEPLASLIQAVIDDGGPYAPSAQGLQDLMVNVGGFAPVALPPMERVRFTEADTGGGTRPDGVANVEFENS